MVIITALQRLWPELPEHTPGPGPVVVQAIVLRDGAAGPEVALVKRTSPRAWELPGGALEAGETWAAAAVREVAEETGLEVQIERLLGWYARTGYRPHRSPVFVCRVMRGHLRANQESVEVAFFPVERLPAGLFPWYRPIIRDAVAGTCHHVLQVQHLGPAAVLAGLAIHLGELAGILR